MNPSDLEAGTGGPSAENESSSPTYQPHGAQNSATAHDQDHASDNHEQSSQGVQAGSEKSNDADQDEPQMVTVDVPMMLSTKQIANQQDIRKQDAVAPRSAKPSTNQSNFTQRSATPNDQYQSSGRHEQSLEGGHDGPEDSNDAAEEGPQIVYKYIPEMLSTNQIRNQQDTRKQDAVAPRSTKPSADHQNLAQRSVTRHDEDQANDEQSSERRQADPSKSDGAAQEEVRTTTYVQPQPKMLSTSQIRNQQDTRKQDAPPPRSMKASPEDVDGSDLHRYIPRRQTPPQIPPVQQSNRGEEPLNQPMPGSQRQASGGKTHSPPRAYSPAVPRNDINERDLEAGTRPTHGLKRDKDKYDIDGRERVILPKRERREQPYTPPKSNYGPGAIPPPEPTYLDRHGRTELQVFQALVGVHFLDNAGAPIPIEQKQQQPASVMSDIFVPSRAAAYRHRNRGLYDRCISMDMKMRVMYSFSHYMISFLYLLQILVAATLTAISSYTNIASTAITVLGAINTVLAGILAWLNGQGMPNRYRRARDQFREVVKAIEASERLFATIDYMDWPEGTRPTPMGEKERLEKLYDQARLDMEANYPDTHQAPDQNAEALEAKKMEAKVDKHKKQKKVAAEALKSLQEEKQQLEAKLASKVGDFVEKHAKDDDYERELQEREETVRRKLEQIVLVKNHYEQRQKNLHQVIIDLCAEKGLDSDEVFEREAASRR